jgi:hypothetical protein
LPRSKKEMAKGTRPTPTPQQKRFIALFKQNVLSGGTKSLKDLMREAGYSDESVRQYSNIMAGLKPHLDPFVERMERHRDAVMTAMEEKVAEARYGELVRGLDTTVKGIRLLTGKSTANVGVIVGERRNELDRLLEG